MSVHMRALLLRFAWLCASSLCVWCSNQQCTGAALNHAVTLVGYGHDAAVGMDYWLIKNSFGKSWGAGGYFRMQRGVNMCGIENWGAVPIVA